MSEVPILFPKESFENIILQNVGEVLQSSLGRHSTQYCKKDGRRIFQVNRSNFEANPLPRKFTLVITDLLSITRDSPTYVTTARKKDTPEIYAKNDKITTNQEGIFSCTVHHFAGKKRNFHQLPTNKSYQHHVKAEIPSHFPFR
ncbi:unnamed protein product [Clavelina lepadiformis]|uniref:Uncharacterized protein n=1 Tax=Clavelina lepadiformis TaxID=159417 RepID=A0ABP0FAU4_CLALP